MAYTGSSTGPSPPTPGRRAGKLVEEMEHMHHRINMLTVVTL